MIHVRKTKPARGRHLGTGRKCACDWHDSAPIERGIKAPTDQLDFATLSELRGDGEGPLNHPCPLCGPERIAKLNQQRKVLRTWELTPGVITFYCVRCEAKGSAQANATQMLQRPRKLKPTRPPSDDKNKLDYVERLWAQAVTPLPAQAISYFRWRHIPLDNVPPGALRLLWHCPWRRETQPCIVARYTDALTGQLKGLWRRPLNGIDKPMTMGPMAGCVIRLWPQADKTMVVGEGVETTLAAATRITYRGKPLQPAWATGCAGNMKRLPVIDGVEHLILLVDNDASGTGQQAAEECTQRWNAAGRKVTRLIPKKSQTDFNDLVKQL